MGELLWQCSSRLSLDKLMLFFYGLLTIWYCRNLEAHGGKGLSIESAALNTSMKMNTFLHLNSNFILFVNRWILVGGLEMITRLKLIVTLPGFRNQEKQVWGV